MPRTSTPIEGLTPWLDSGDLGRVVEAFARWVDAAPEDAEATLEIKQWDLHYPGGRSGSGDKYDLWPVAIITLAFGVRGYQGWAKVHVWRGADPGLVPATLDRALRIAKQGNRSRKQGKTTYHLDIPEFTLEPGKPDAAP